jgi:hypothetical protein
LASYRYARGGFEVESDWPLPGLASPVGPLQGSRGHVSIRRGDTPDEIPHAVRLDSGTQILPDQMLFSHPRFGRFWVRGGEEVIVTPATADGGLGELGPFVLGAGFAAICIQRGQLLLHASAAAVDGRAVAFAGPKGAGKSTLLAALVQAGCPPMADDLCFIEPVAGALPRLWPAPGRLRLKPDSAQALGLDAGPAADREVSGSGKLELPLDALACPDALPLAAVFILRLADICAPRIEAVEGPAAIADLAQQLFRPHFVLPMGALASLMPRLAQTMGGGLRILRLAAPRRYAALPQTLAAVNGVMRA